MVENWDMSDNDFCPPIDYDLLTPEEIEMLKEMGLFMEDGGVGSSEADGGIASASETVNDENILQPDAVSTTTDQIIATSTESAVETTTTITEEQPAGLIDSIINNIVEEVIPDEPIDEPVESVEVPADNQVNDQIVEPVPAEEAPIISQVPATKEQPAVVPSNDLTEPPTGE
jgi:hypothetical protein